MSPEDREFVMFQNPDKVRAAGLWPGVEGDRVIFSAIASDALLKKDGRLVEVDPAEISLKARRVPWHELSEEVQTAFVNDLRRRWPTMSLAFQRITMARDPEEVKAAGLWPEE